MICFVCAVATLTGAAAQAQSRIGADQGKLLLTAGFTDAEGAGGRRGSCRLRSSVATARTTAGVRTSMQRTLMWPTFD